MFSFAIVSIKWTIPNNMPHLITIIAQNPIFLLNTSACCCLLKFISLVILSVPDHLEDSLHVVPVLDFYLDQNLVSSLQTKHYLGFCCHLQSTRAQPELTICSETTRARVDYLFRDIEAELSICFSVHS